MIDTSPDTVRMLIDLWKAQCEVDEDTPSPPSLALALGLGSTGELEELARDPALTLILQQAHLWMEAYWYRLLKLSNREVSAASVSFALKTMGRRDTEKGKGKGTLHLHFHGGHKTL